MEGQARGHDISAVFGVAPDPARLRANAREDIADRVRLCLKYAPPDRLSFAPDCGLSQTARWAAKQKLASMVGGVKIVRKELGLSQ